MRKYIVKSYVNKKLYPIPINLETLKCFKENLIQKDVMDFLDRKE